MNRSGQTGEYYVLYRLSAMGLLASLAPPGAPQIDILAFDSSEQTMASIQVKTRSNANDGGWHVKKSNTRLASDFHFFAFVDLGGQQDQFPSTYIVPSRDVTAIFDWIEQIKPDNLSQWLSGFDDTCLAKKKKLDMCWLQLNLKTPPPGMPNQWMSASYLEAWYLISTPLFKNMRKINLQDTSVPTDGQGKA